MKKLKKVVSLILICLIVTSIVGCNNNSTSGDEWSTYEVEEIVESGGNASDNTSTVSSKNTGAVSSKNTGAVSSENTGTVSSENTGAVSSENTGTVSSKNETSSTKAVTKANESTWENMLKSLPSHAKGRTITIYSWNEKEATTGAVNAIAKFEKDTGVKVKWVSGSYDGYTSEISALISGKKSPDVIRLKTLDPSVLSLCQPLSASGYDFSGDIWDSQVRDYYTVNGKAFGISVKGTLLQQPTVLYYNKSLASQFDMEDPYTLWKKGKWTWKSFVNYCKTFKEEAGDEYDAWSLRIGTDILANYADLDFVTFEGNQFVNKMNDSKVISLLKETCDVYSSGITTGSWWNQAGFNSGKTMFFTDSIIGARKTHFYYSDMKTKGTLGVVPFPLNDDNGTRYQEFAEYEAYAIPKGSENADLVPYFLRCYLDSANYDSKNFFFNANALEVYNWCMGQSSRCVKSNVSGAVITADVGITRNDLMQAFMDKSSGQVETILKTYSAQVQNAVNRANAKLKQVG